MITLSDASPDSLHVYTGEDALNKAIARYLPVCSRSTQEQFLQILTDHIRMMNEIEGRQ